MTVSVRTFDTPFGPFTFVADGGTVIGAAFTADLADVLQRCDAEPPVETMDDDHPAARAFRAYLAGDVRALDTVPVAPRGSEAMQRYWSAMRRIPAGETLTYAALGGDRSHARSAGSACNRNPIAVFVPCHRVVRAGGDLGGFAVDVGIKRWLLAHEAAHASAAQPKEAAATR